MRKIILLLVTCLSHYAFAQRLDPTAEREVRLGNPQFIGNGCGRGTATASISDDRQTLSVLFDNYIVEVGGNLRRRVERKACNILVPVHVPRGYSVAVFKVDYRGFNSLPQGATAQFNMDYFFGGRLGPRNVQTFRGPLEDDFVTNNDVSAANMEWSPCGMPMQFRAHSALIVTTNRESEQAISTIDSADLTAGVQFKLQWRRCTPRGGRG